MHPIIFCFFGFLRLLDSFFDGRKDRLLQDFFQVSANFRHLFCIMFALHLMEKNNMLHSVFNWNSVCIQSWWVEGGFGSSSVWYFGCHGVHRISFHGWKLLHIPTWFEQKLFNSEGWNEISDVFIHLRDCGKSFRIGWLWKYVKVNCVIRQGNFPLPIHLYGKREGDCCLQVNHDIGANMSQLEEWWYFLQRLIEIYEAIKTEE